MTEVAPPARLLIVHHSPSPNLMQLTDQVIAGASAPELVGVEVIIRAALEATADDVVGADGYLLGTPANLGYMSGALKHFFDTTYNQSLDVTRGRPYGLWLHGESDTEGARLGIDKIVTGLQWRRVQDPLSIIGPPEPSDLEACWELGAATAATLL